MGCGATSARARYTVEEPKEADAGTAPPTAASPDTNGSDKSLPSARDNKGSYRKKGGDSGNSLGSHKAPQQQQQQSPVATAAAATVQAPLAAPTPEEQAQAPQAQNQTCEEWWAMHAEWIQLKAVDVLAAYNSFFEHIGIRKGWRTPPFGREEVQAPFQAASEVVTVVRARLDAEAGGGVVLRQLEGSSMNFLWGWKPDRPPWSSREALEEFFRGLVFATLSDGRGLVEGLDNETVEQYVCCHPFVAVAAQLASESDAAAAADGAAADVSMAEEAACDGPPGTVLEVAGTEAVCA